MRPPARRALSARDEGAADAAATMAGTEQGDKAEKHDSLHNGFDRCALAVFESNFRSGRFSEQTAGSCGLRQFTVKRPFQNEISLKPAESGSTRGVRCIHRTAVCSPHMVGTLLAIKQRRLNS
jgi:hypothetical protein